MTMTMTATDSLLMEIDNDWYCNGCGETGGCHACTGYEDDCEECLEFVVCFECRRRECIECVECSWSVCPCCQRFICDSCMRNNHYDLKTFHDCKI